jgi:hypothetical protein
MTSRFQKDIKIFTGSIILLPLWWILGFDFFIYHLVSIYIFLRQPFAFSPSSFSQKMLLLIPFFLIVGAAVSFLGLEYDGFRYIAALNNISILLVGYCYFSFSRYLLVNKYLKYVEIWKAGFYIALIYIFLSALLFYVVVGGGEALSLPTLLGLITPPAPGLLGQYQHAMLVSTNWFLGDFQPRLFIFAPFATGTALIGCIIAFWGGAYLNENGWGVIKILLFMILMLIGVLLTLSRATSVGYFLGLIIILAYYIPNKFYPSILIMLPLLFIALSPILLSAFQAGLESRQGSTDTRFFAYTQALKVVVEENLFTGIGVKPRSDNLIIPIGSHSSFIGVLVRGGVLALIPALIFFLVLPMKSCYLIFTKKSHVHSIKRGSLIFMLGAYACCVPFLIFQDIDAYPSLCILVLLTLSIIDSLTSFRAENKVYVQQ